MDEDSITLLIYMASDNNLCKASLKNLDSIRKASKNSFMNIIVQLDCKPYPDTLEGFRYYFKNGKEQLIKNLGEVNSGDPDTLKNFINELSLEYPSNKLMLVISSHGTGVDDRNFYNPLREEIKRKKFFEEQIEQKNIGIAFDDDSGDFIDNVELKEALSSRRKIDVLGFDACLMAMFEVAYQLRDEANVIVASQYLEPETGWAYSKIVNNLKHRDSNKEIGSKIVEFYAESYEGTPNYVTQSAYDMNMVKEVASALSDFAEFLQKNTTQTILKKILEETETFSRDDYIDLIDFVKKTDKKLAMNKLSILVIRLLAYLDLFVIANKTIGSNMENVYGVSIYFPHKKAPIEETFDGYELLDFSKDYPAWINLIRWFYYV